MLLNYRVSPMCSDDNLLVWLIVDTKLNWRSSKYRKMSETFHISLFISLMSPTFYKFHKLYINFCPCVLWSCCFIFSNRGNALLIGSIGAHLNSLAALALYMLEYPIHPVDCTYPNTFLDGLRSAVRQAGCDGKTTTVLFTVSMHFGAWFPQTKSQWGWIWIYLAGYDRLSFILRFRFKNNLYLFHSSPCSEELPTVATRQSFWLIFDSFLMAFISTGQSKCKNYERRRCQAPRSRSDNWHLHLPQFLQFDLLV